MMRKKIPAWKYFIYPFTLLYGIIVFVRNALFDFQIIRSRSFNIPVISVGNISVGGTGKTPFVEYIANLLKNNYSIASLSRGYKRKTRSYREVEPESHVRDVGDEALQIKHKHPEITVAVERKRGKGIKKLIAKHKNLNGILLDDGFQHRSVKPGLSILLIDYNRLIYNDHLLPFGRLREPIHEKKRADIVVITKTPSDVKPIDQRIIKNNLKLYPYQDLFFSYIKYGPLTPIYPDYQQSLSKETCTQNKYTILMVSAIADAQTFREHLQSISPQIEELQYRDHYQFKKKDLKKITDVYDSIENPNKIIVTTEKDAMRFRSMENMEESLKRSFYYIPLEVDFLTDEEKDEFNSIILRYITEKKKNDPLQK